jgi:D-alanyl-D-alanine carboxypeptidase
MMMERFVTLQRPAGGRLRSLLATLAVLGVMVAAAPAAMAAQGSAIVVDAKTGKVLYSDNPDGQRYPASLTKMMTLYLLFEAIDAGKVSLSSTIPISAHAAAQAPSKLGLKPGETISVRDAILAVVTRSANDIAVAIAEYLGGSEDAFAAKMTAKAHALGMSRTAFHNASGLPDPGQLTTARDMSTLGRALHDRFPRYFAFFSAPSFTYGGHRIPNHDHLLGRVAGVNGIKTGYTRASGYNLVTSVERDGRRMVAVVLGGPTARARDRAMATLVDTYMPRAATSGKAAIADAAPVAPASPQAAPPATSVALAAPAPTLRSRLKASEPAETGSIAATPVAAAEPAPAPDRVTDEGDGGDDAVAGDPPSATPRKPAIAKVPSGWKIQIAAAPSDAQAKDQLDKVRSKAGKLLASASPYTEPVVKGGATLYRARFSGFPSKDKAEAACAALGKQKISCLAIQ